MNPERFGETNSESEEDRLKSETTEGSPETTEAAAGTGTKEATPEGATTPEQRLEALKQKADQLHERIAGFLDNQFGSVDAARTYANNRQKVSPMADGQLFVAGNYLSALREVEELQGFMNGGHEAYDARLWSAGNSGPGGIKSFDAALDHWDYVASDRNLKFELPEAKGKFKENMEQQVEVLTGKTDVLLAKFNQLIKTNGGEEGTDHDYLQLQEFSKALASSSEDMVRVREDDGKLQVSYHPLNKWKNAEDELMEFEQKYEQRSRH
jgi:hypothetical protein